MGGSLRQNEALYIYMAKELYIYMAKGLTIKEPALRRTKIPQVSATTPPSAYFHHRKYLPVTQQMVRQAFATVYANSSHVPEAV